MHYLKDSLSLVMAVVCKFCNHEFSNKCNLTLHQKTAKYCLALREIATEKTLKCEYCDKKFVRKSTLFTHMKICLNSTKRFKHLVDIQKEEIATLKKTIIEKDDLIAELKLTAKKGMLVVNTAPQPVNNYRH